MYEIYAHQQEGSLGKDTASDRKGHLPDEANPRTNALLRDLRDPQAAAYRDGYVARQEDVQHAPRSKEDSLVSYIAPRFFLADCY